MTAHLNEQLTKQLAELVGFHHSYTDCFGQQVFPKDEALHSLLNAMGYKLDCTEALEQQIIELQENNWRIMLPASYIAKHEDSQHHVTISLPESNTESLMWQLTLENGDTSSSELPINSLHVIDQTTLGQTLFTKYSLVLPAVALGYHTLTLTYGNTSATCHVICAPKTCFSPQEANVEKMWGYAAQLYSLRSNKNWGMGDFGDLNNLITNAAQQGASAIGLNPLHPLFQNNPAHRSPYSPTSRCFLNTIYIDVTQVSNFASCEPAQTRYHSEEFQNKLEFARSTELIDYPAVADIKFDIIRHLYADFIKQSTTTAETAFNEFCLFKQKHGEDLLRLTTFDALYEFFREKNYDTYGWKMWPAAYQSPDTPEVLAFQTAEADRIDFFAYIQWLAHCQLSDVAQNATDSGMPVGLYLDLAVGCDGSGVDVWSDKEVYVSGASVGAPPDAMNTLGQDWGLTPINPVALKAQGYLPLVKALRSNMQYAGALRIDHILGLMRQYWVAPGMQAHEGVYITFPLEDILRIIALESRRESCIVIGEDLGTVPDGFGEIMASAGLLSYKVLFFETWESGLFKRPEEYPAQSMVTVSTHDLPTLSGWWTGRDLTWRQTLNLYPNDDIGQQERQTRIDDRARLLDALDDMNVMDMNNAPSQSPAQMNTELSIAVQKYMAHAPSHIQLIPLEDALEVVEQVNIPGTVDEHPNWRQKLPVTLEDFWQTPSVLGIASAMKAARPLK